MYSCFGDMLFGGMLPGRTARILHRQVTKDNAPEEYRKMRANVTQGEDRTLACWYDKGLGT